MQVFRVSTRGKSLVLLPRMADGGIVPVSGIYRCIIRQDQELLGDAVDFLTEGFRATRLARPAGE